MKLARQNMVESQVRTNDVTDHRIINTMLELPREVFVPGELQSLAYMEEDLQVKAKTSEEPARYLMAPMNLAKLLQLAEINSDDVVLDVGCGTGYSTVVISKLCGSVVGLECNTDLSERAGENLLDLGVDNGAVLTGPLNEGCGSEGPFDVIFFNGSVAKVSDEIIDQLKDRGKIVVVLSETGFGKACVFVRSGENISKRAAFDANVPVLPGFEVEKEFVF